MKNAKSKKIFGAVLAAVLALGTIAGSLAYFTDVDDKLNNITMGKVDITLTEDMEDPDNPGEEKPYEDPDRVQPGDEVSKIVRVTNEEDSAYIRIKVEYPTVEAEQKITYESLIGIDESKWTRVSAGENADYFYYNTPVNTDEVIELFTGVDIPIEWDNTMSLDTFSLNVTAEAIQSANITIPEGQGIHDVWDTLGAEIIPAEQ